MSGVGCESPLRRAFSGTLSVVHFPIHENVGWHVFFLEIGASVSLISNKSHSFGRQISGHLLGNDSISREGEIDGGSVDYSEVDFSSLISHESSVNGGLTDLGLGGIDVSSIDFVGFEGTVFGADDGVVGSGFSVEHGFESVGVAGYRSDLWGLFESYSSCGSSVTDGLDSVLHCRLIFLFSVGNHHDEFSSIFVYQTTRMDGSFTDGTFVAINHRSNNRSDLTGTILGTFNSELFSSGS